jgi:hypothetical protein
MAISRGPKMVTNGLVLVLDAADKNSYPGSGTTWIDMSGNNNHGTLTNGPAFSNGNGGNFGFDGADDYVISATQLGISGATSRSFECWTYISSNQSKNIMGYGDNGTLNLFDTIIWYTSPYLQVIGHYYGGNNDTISTLPSRNTLNINQWNHIIHLYDGTNASLYTNGILSNSKSFTLNTTNSTLLLGAGKYTGFNYFGGKVALGRIYNRSLTATEVLQNYNATKSRFGL